MLLLPVLLDRCQHREYDECMARPRHPKKAIEKAIAYAESLGWRVEMSNGHAWGHILCPHRGRDGCSVGVYSTPRDQDNHAQHVQRQIDLCPHRLSDTEGNAPNTNLEDDHNGTQEAV